MAHARYIPSHKNVVTPTTLTIWRRLWVVAFYLACEARRRSQPVSVSAYSRGLEPRPASRYTYRPQRGGRLLQLQSIHS